MEANPHLLPQSARPRLRKHRGIGLYSAHATLSRRYSQEQKRVLRSVENLARTCAYEASHTHHVTRLALRLFDELHRLHHLRTIERFYLECAGILHDIGWIEGWKGHHKTSLNIILHTTLLPMDNRERLIVGSVARYHTRALPSLAHDHFASLTVADRQIVLVLAAILRLADGLDRTHNSQVQNVQCQITHRKIRLSYLAAARQKKNEKVALKNSDLLQKVFQRKIFIRWDPQMDVLDLPETGE